MFFKIPPHLDFLWYNVHIKEIKGKGDTPMSSITYIRIDFTNGHDFSKIPSTNSSVFNHKMTYYQHYFYINLSPNLPIKKYVCGIDASPPLYTIKKRLISDEFLIFVIDGCGTINGREFRAGQYFYIPANYRTTIISDKEHPYTLCWISWEGEISPEFAKNVSFLSPNNLYVLPNPQQFKRFFSGYLHLDHTDSNVDFMIKSFAELLASLIAKNHRICTDDTQLLISNKSIDYINHAKEIISQQYATIDIEELAKLLHLNRMYFCQLFRLIEGVSPQQYLINTRLQSSVYYLEDTNLSLKDIAQTIGYSSYNGFVAAFKAKYGMTPKVYRQKYQKRWVSQ